MKIVPVAIVMMGLMAVPAFAQMGGNGGRHRHSDDGTSGQNRPKVDEKAYRAALKSIPEPKTKYDPWGKMR